jgi:nitroimidazol reductase NimA-like FMN-containing flavoprotein (pyridoxamine 5'-phosphate oxidase superfamily)
MTTSSSWKSGRLRELDSSECLELLGTRSVGRVAFCTDEGPVVLPVNYVVRGEDVLFRTSPHNSIARYASGHPAAFEVDEVDDFTQSGWSVLMRGTAELVEDVHDIPTESRPVPWAEGTRSLFVRVRTRSITGRRLFPT